MERIGWQHVRRARATGDEGHYTLARQAALCLEQLAPGDPAAALLLGHALHAAHRFREAEAVARELTARLNDAWMPHALLGDVLLDTGRIDAATEHYQRVMNLRPGPEAYARAAEVRWRRGDLVGAIDFLQRSARATTGEPGAWMRARLALLELQRNRSDLALRLADTALRLQPGHPAARHARARALSSAGDMRGAARTLADASLMPADLWLLADAAQRSDDRDVVTDAEARLAEHGQRTDPRTLALYLATRGRDPERAVRLARRELEDRTDAHTYDALAWALLSAGRTEEAREPMQQALADETADARLFYHAAVLEHRLGNPRVAERFARRAAAMSAALYPSERDDLNERFTKTIGPPPVESSTTEGGERNETTS